MTSMMEAMLSMRQMMENNAAAVAATNATIEADPTQSSAINQTSQPVPDMVGQGGEVLGSRAIPMWCKIGILFHHTAYPPTIHHPTECTCPTRTPTTLFPFPIKATNPTWGIHPLFSL